MNVKMLVVQGRPAGKTLVFAAGEYYFGRGAECHIRPNSEWVSRQHCPLRVTRAEAYLRDLGSRNGTLVNGRLIHEECRLLDGDQVQIGPLVLTVRFDDLNSSPRAEAPELTAPEAWEAPTVTLAGLESIENLPALPNSPPPSD
jgi:pSer/pThr/pTyr-binding forkhead associated (FHA) protein